MFGKAVADLQDSLTVSGTRISGNLAFIDDYTGFSSDVSLQEGHYMALKFTAPEDSITTIQMIGGEVVRDPVQLDQDMNAVLRVADPEHQKLKVVVKKDGFEDLVTEYSLTGLTFID